MTLRCYSRQKCRLFGLSLFFRCFIVVFPLLLLQSYMFRWILTTSLQMLLRLIWILKIRLNLPYPRPEFSHFPLFLLLFFVPSSLNLMLR